MMTRHPRGTVRLAIASLAMATTVTTGSLALSSNASAESGSKAGQAGTDTSLPATDSAVTATGRGRFRDLRIVVNQTRGLASQAVSVSWTGGRPSTGFSANWLQVFQCWGDDDGANAQNPGPPPEQCQYGGEPFAGDISKKIPAGTNPSNVYSRVIANDNWSTFDESQGDYDRETGKLWKPFRAVDGTVISRQLRLTNTTNESGVTVAWQNPYYAFTTTNEDPWGKTYGNGAGSVLFQVHTGLEAPGLGCGQETEPRADGSRRIPKCWLVVVPRGTPQEENPENLTADGFDYVAVSPLAPSAWANRIAVPLEFNPINSGCAMGGNQRRIVGGEMAAGAVVNWQPTLCAANSSAPFAFQAIGDEQARRQVLAAGPGSAGMGIVNHPLRPEAVDPEAPVTYAPVALSGVVIGFNVERVPVGYDGTVKDPGEKPLAGLRVTNINLTPRLVAKLITQSYPTPFPNLNRANPPDGYRWLSNNPEHVFRDPDFLQFNPEFEVISIGSPRSGGGLIVEAARADAAIEVWRWILADGEARAWLAGKPDPWGMNVNPLFSTDAAVNPSGSAFADPVPDSFPKNDPYCYQAPDDGDITPRPLCMLDAAPLALSMEQAAKQTRAANDQATVEHDPHSPAQQTSSTYWGTEGPQIQGRRSILSITDAASAARYGLQTASLSRSGDDGEDREFIPPTVNNLVNGVKAMATDPRSGVLIPDATARVAGAYPLALVSYAAVAPATLDPAARDDYARFVTFAAGPGQTPGFAFGRLPTGYAPLPAALRAQALAAAAAIAAGQAVPVSADGVSAFAAGSEGGPGSVRSRSGESAFAGLVPSDVFATNRPSTPGTNASGGLRLSSASPGATPGFWAGPGRFALPALIGLGAGAAFLLAALDRRRLWARTTGVLSWRPTSTLR